MKNAIALITIAGRTTKTNSSLNTIPAPKTKIAVDKNTVPDTTVPTHVSKTATDNLLAYLFSKSTNPKKTNAVI